MDILNLTKEQSLELLDLRKKEEDSALEMWTDAKRGEYRQIWQMCKFISTDIKLLSAIKALDWDGVATLYNGAGYKELAAKYHRDPYNVSMKTAYLKYKNL